MHHWHRRGTLFFLGTLLIIGLLAVLGCDDGSGDFDSAESRELENQQFIFPNGGAFNFPGRRVTLRVKNFGADGTPDVAPATLITPDGSARGTIDVDEDDFVDGGLDLTPESECDIDIASSTSAVLPVGTILHFRPCDVNDDTGQLRVVNDLGSAESISRPPSPLE